MQLVVGRVRRPHGIRGELTVRVHTDARDLRLAAGSVPATEPAARGPLTVSASRWHSGRLLVTFAGYAGRSQAEELRGTLLVMDSSEVGPAADPEEFHDYELIGLEVLTPPGEPVAAAADALHQAHNLRVIRPEPWGGALDALIPSGRPARLVLPSPAGVPFTQETATEYARESHLVFGCGRYEGIDARVAAEARARMPVDEVTIGDYVLAGGEPAVLVMIHPAFPLLPAPTHNAHPPPHPPLRAAPPPLPRP